MPDVLPRLVPYPPVSHVGIAAQLPVHQVGHFLLFHPVQAVPPGVGKGAIAGNGPKIGGDKHHVNRGALHHGELPATRHGIQHLARGADLGIGLADVLQPRHGQRGDDAENRNHRQHLNEREGGERHMVASGLPA